MTDIKRKWNRLSDEKRKSSIDELILFFENERDEKIGIVAAEQILNFFLQSVGDEIYNRGVEDAKKVLEKRFEDFRYDLDDLIEL